MKAFVAILISFLVPLAPAFATAQETQSERGIAVAKKTPAAVQVTGTPRLVAQLGHTGGATVGALSPDGRYALTAAGDDDTAAVLWDVASGKELRRFVTKHPDFTKLAFTPDGARVLTASTFAVRLFDTQTGSEIHHFKFEGQVADMDLAPHGKQLLLSVFGQGVALFDVDTGQELRRFSEKGSSDGTSVAFSPDGRRALFGGANGRSTLRDVETGEEVRSFVTRERYVQDVISVAFSPDGKRVLTAMAGYVPNKGRRGKCVESNDGHCTTLWDVETGESLRRFRVSAESYGSVVFSPDGKRVVNFHPLSLWDVETGAEVMGAAKYKTAIALAPDGKHALTRDDDSVNVIQLWSLEADKEVQRFEPRGTTEINSANWSRDGQRVLTSDANKAYLWDLAVGKVIQTFSGSWEMSSGGRPNDVYYDYLSTPVERAVLSPDGHRVLTVGSEAQAILWDAATGAELQRFEGHKGPVWSGAISPDGRLVATGGYDRSVRIWDVKTGRQLASLKARWAVLDVEFSSDGALLAAGAGDNPGGGQLLVWDVATRKNLKGFSAKRFEGPVATVAFSPDSQYVINGVRNRETLIWDINSGELSESAPVIGVSNSAFSPDGTRVAVVKQPAPYIRSENAVDLYGWPDAAGTALRLEHDGPVNSVAFSPDGKWVLTGSGDRTTRIWDATTGDEKARLVAFEDVTFAVIDPEGRFDAPNGGDIDGLHWVAGLEPIALSQLKSRYYEPGLLAKILGLSEEPLRDVESLMAGVDLFPEVIVTQAPSESDRSLKLQLNNRGGGIGRVTVFVNGKEVDEDARGSGADSEARQLDLVVDLSANPFFVAGQDNLIEVVAYNAENYMASPRMRMTVAASGAEVVAEKPQLWSIVAGTSDYLGSGLDLRFAAKDAEDFATALDVAASRLLGPERVHITRLYDGAVPATRASMAAAFDTFKLAKPGDILVLYLAGHGVAFGGQDGDYYYLLQDAESGDIRNADIRAKSAVSSEQLTEWIKQVPALKQVMILDTCHAGQLITDLTKTRSLPSSEQRSLDRMKDRTGMFIIAGSAADAVSYEASRYGQGVLTYSLLEGMRGAALREDAFVDVGQLLTYAVDRVPALARGIGGIQQPRLATPSGGESFDMGWLPAAADLAKIPIAQERPLLLKTTFTPEDQPLDLLELTPMVNEALRARAADPRNAPFVFVEADQSAGAWRVAGRYSVTGTTVTLKVYLYRDKSVAGQFDVQGQTGTLDTLTAEIVRQVETHVKP